MNCLNPSLNVFPDTNQTNERHQMKYTSETLEQYQSRDWDDWELIVA